MQQAVKGFSFKVRIIHMLLFELFGLIIFTPIATLVLHRDLMHVGTVSILISVCAMLWNLIYNWLFDWVEHQLGKNRFERGVLIRCLHALLFEAGLLIATVPMVAHFLNMTYMAAFFVDIAFVVFFLIYAFIYNWIFDQIYLKLSR